MTNIAAALTAAAAAQPEAVALTVTSGAGYRSWTFAEIEAQAGNYAVFLASTISRGDRVILMVKPSMEFICLAFALFSLGAVVILIDPGMGYRNLLRCIGSVKPRFFIGIPKAQLFRKLFRRHFQTVRASICVGCNPLGLFGRSLPAANQAAVSLAVAATRPAELAAIIFTTGSTGPPKGVQYSHAVFQAQLKHIREYYGIGAGDVDQPAFPLFGLFSIALGARAVIPDMDPSRPAKVDPEKFIRTIREQRVTFSFGSPAIWNVISRHCLAQKSQLPSLKKVLMAGAPVAGDLIARTQAILAADAEIHTPYGATESLPMVSITGREIMAETWPLTREGWGVCVGRPLPGIEVRVIAVAAGPVSLEELSFLPPGEKGEIIVKGDVVTRAYDHNEAENALAKIIDGEGFWHRMGDIGYFDAAGRLWFCGRKAHLVETAAGPLYTICCEAIFNTHPLVARSALVGIGARGSQQPVLIVESRGKIAEPAQLFSELRALAATQPHCQGIRHFLLHPSFPVDIRHNAKIFREKLAVWAAGCILT